MMTETQPHSGNRLLQMLISVAAFALAGWIWWIAATLTTSWLLGRNEWFQQIVILVIATLQTSGLFTLIALGGIYLLISALELALWPRGRRNRLLWIFWLPLVLLDCVAAYQGFGVYYAGLLGAAGLPAADWAEPLLGVMLAPLLAIGPEALIILVLRRVWKFGIP
ncbi:MAG: hypothetical protein HC822_15145 [Oscillochloris sp.]|nr:hypothetical protein [Oscillochloris sp.]